MSEINKLYEKWLSYQPLSEDASNRLRQKFMLEFNYNSNHIYNPQNETFKIRKVYTR